MNGLAKSKKSVDNTLQP